MPCHISVRDVIFTPSTEGVRIVAVTDVPCYLTCRLSEQEPHIHKKAVLRRGMWLNDDVRFCFTVFEDNSQYEVGDTLIHTFWKPNWPVCTTKWFYFWGYVAGEVCQSTTAIFNYHNDGISPVPTPDIMYTINSIQPERILGVGIATWCRYSLVGIVPPGATGIVGIAVNADTGQERYFGIRPPDGSGHDYGVIKREGMTGFVCGLDENLEFEMFVGYPTVVYIRIMGYTGKNVVFLKDAINLHPTVANTWVDIDTHLLAPFATACLWSCGTQFTHPGGWKMRVNGSTDDWWNGGYHTYPAIGVGADGITQCQVTNFGLARNTTRLLGYITSNFEKHVNAVNITPGSAASWVRTSVQYNVIKPPWVSIQLWESASHLNLYGMRKSRTYFDEKRNSGGGDWILVHADPGGYVDLWLPLITRKFYLHGEFTRDIA